MSDLKKYLSFNGRAGRAEFWLITLVISAIVLVPAYVIFRPYSDDARYYVEISALITLWPLLAVQVRRWHDRNKSGWWVLMNFVPVVGFFWVLIENGFLAGTNEGNRF